MFSSKFLSWCVRLSVFLAIIYVLIAYFFYFVYPPRYSYRKENFSQTQATILIQPFMEVFGYQKVSHWYDWKDVSEAEIPKIIQPLSIFASSDYRKLDEKNPIRNTLASLGKVTESAIVEPVNYSGKWSIVFCTQDRGLCQESNILVKGRVKILVDGNGELWGKSQQNEIIQLRIVGYITRDRYKSVVHV